MEVTITNISLALSATSIIGLLLFIIKVSMAIGVLKLKVDTMWAFQMRRAMSEAVDDGVGSLNSPLVFSDDARERLNPIKQDLIAFYAKLPPKLTDGEILLKIEHEFGDRLLIMVCVPCGLSHGACLLLAMAIARQTDTLDLKL